MAAVLRLATNDAGRGTSTDSESAALVPEQIHENFRHRHDGTRLISFYETLPTLRNTSELIVEQRSATLGFTDEATIPLPCADHLNICRFPGPDNPNFTRVRETLASTVNDVLGEMHDPERVRDQMSRLASYLGVSDLEEEVLISLQNLEVEGSCSWLLKKEPFVAWRDASQADEADDGSLSARMQSSTISGAKGPREPIRYFWLTGAPGAGKTVLAGHVARHLQDRGRCYCYFLKHADKSRQNASGLLKSLAFQIARHDLSVRESFLEMQHENDFTAETHDIRTIWKQLFIQRIFRANSLQPQFWVIDGFDDAHGGYELLPLFAKIPVQLPISLFLTSRRDKHLEKQITRLPVNVYHIDVRDTTKDIRLYLEENQDDLPVSSPQAVEELITKLVKKSQGSFLWTRLILERLQEAWTDVAIDQALQSIPEGLQQMYADILERMAQNDESNIRLAQSVLRWATCSARSLTTPELQDAIRLDIGQKVDKLKQMLESVCGQLVFVDDQGRIQLVHDTARDFILAHDLSSPFAIDKAKAHERLADVCFQYLTDDFRVTTMRRPPRSSQESVSEIFREYANLYFSEHLVKCSQDISQTLMTRVETIFDVKVLAWIEYIAREKKDVSHLTQTAKNLKRFSEQRANWTPPLSPDMKVVQEWATDLIRLVAVIGHAILSEPSIIHRIIPPLCPPASIIHRRFGNPTHGMEVVGLTSRGWNDRIYSASYTHDEATALACCDRRYAVGLRRGKVILYYATTCQEAIRLETGALVKFLEFARGSSWIIVCASKIWAIDLSAEPMALCLTEDEQSIMMATKQNALVLFDTVDGSIIEETPWRGHGEDRPPKRVFMASDMNLLALVYRNKDIALFEPENLDRPRMAAVEADVQVMAFNPAQNMLVVGFFEGELCTIGMWNIHRPVNRTEADASHLAVSSDGKTLIVVINFDEEEAIVSMMFTGNGLRFLDIRRAEFNVWEPSILVRRKDHDDSTSEGQTSYSTAPSELVQAYTQGEHNAITALVSHHTGDYIFCGKDNGIITVFETRRGRQIKELFRHANNSVVSIDWNAEGNVLVSADSASRVLVHRLREAQTRGSSGKRLEFIPHRLAEFRVGQAISQTLFSGSGDWFLTPTIGGQAHAWTLDGKSVTSLPAQQKKVGTSPAKKWIVHPRTKHKLLGIGQEAAQVLKYERTQATLGIDGVPIEASHRVDSQTRDLGIHFVEFAEGVWAAYDDNAAARPVVWSATPSLTDTSGVTEAALAYFKRSVSGIRDLIGFYRAKIVFVDLAGWICSLSFEEADSERRMARHFPIPHSWQSTRRRIIAAVTMHGDVVIAKGDELVIVKRGLTTHV